MPTQAVDADWRTAPRAACVSMAPRAAAVVLTSRRRPAPPPAPGGIAGCDADQRADHDRPVRPRRDAAGDGAEHRLNDLLAGDVGDLDRAVDEGLGVVDERGDDAGGRQGALVPPDP